MDNLLKGIMTDKGIAKYDLNALAGDLAIPACPVFPIWLCDASTSDYTCKMGQTSSTCSLTPDEFLSMFYDCHLKNYDDGYKVTKRILGRDESNTYDIFEYTFTPKKYSRTVMLSSGMHPPELPAEFGLAYFMKYVMEKDSADFKWLRNNVRFKVVPLIQPWGFGQSTIEGGKGKLVYENSRNVNLNKNWDVDHVWTPDLSFGGAGSNGTDKYSEAETRILVNWVNENAYKVDLWIDCHTDSSGYSSTRNRLHYIMGCSNSTLRQKIQETQTRITQAYIKAGFFEYGAAGTSSNASGSSPTSYTAKHSYSQKYCGIPSFMIEQYSGNPLWGGDPITNNTEADINNYITMIRAFILAWLERDEIVMSSNDMFWYLYHWYMDNHYQKTTAISSAEETYPTFNVTYNINGHGIQPSNLTNVSSLPKELPILTETTGRYVFKGWYLDADLMEEAIPGQMLLSDVTLYAKWKDEDNGPIEWYIGGIDTNTGANNGNDVRAQTDLIKVQANGVIEITNMSDYALVDVAVHKEDGSYRGLTTKYTLTKSDDGTWTIQLTNFFTNFAGCKYIRFSVKRTDGAKIGLSEFDDTVITRS